MTTVLFTKVSDLGCPYVKQLLQEACRSVNYALHHYPEHSVNDLLSIIFSKHKISQRQVEPIPGNFLCSKMQNLAGTPIYDFAKQLAAQRSSVQVGAYDGKVLLTFLKDCFLPEKKIQRLAKGLPFRR
jgi:hypothetical protein